MTATFLAHALTEASFRVDMVLKLVYFFLSLTPAKILSERTQVKTPLLKKTVSTSPAAPRSVRKALGNVNRTQGVTSKLEKIRQKSQHCAANKVSTVHLRGTEGNFPISFHCLA